MTFVSSGSRQSEKLLAQWKREVDEAALASVSRGAPLVGNGALERRLNLELILVVATVAAPVFKVILDALGLVL
jgi:hypothetical protein